MLSIEEGSVPRSVSHFYACCAWFHGIVRQMRFVAPGEGLHRYTEEDGTCRREETGVLLAAFPRCKCATAVSRCPKLKRVSLDLGWRKRAYGRRAWVRSAVETRKPTWSWCDIWQGIPKLASGERPGRVCVKLYRFWTNTATSWLGSVRSTTLSCRVVHVFRLPLNLRTEACICSHLSSSPPEQGLE